MISFKYRILQALRCACTGENLKARGKLSEESKKGNTTANAILNAASSSVEAQHDITVVPLENKLQTVSPEEFEAVKKVWHENIKHLKCQRNLELKLRGGFEWIKRDMTGFRVWIDLLVRLILKRKKKAVNKVTSLLPFPSFWELLFA